MLSPLLAALILPALADVHVVDPGGGPGKALLEDALHAAQSGDIILLRAGNYGPSPGALGVSGKAVSIVFDEGVSGIVLPALLIDAVPAGEAFVIRDLDIKGSAGSVATIQFTDSDGILWLEGVHVAGVAASTGEGPPAVSVQGGRLVAVRSDLLGASAGDSVPVPLLVGLGGPGIQLGSSDTAALWESLVRGGDGGDGAPLFAPSQGGHGVWMKAEPGTVIATDCVVAGGPEGSGTNAKPGAGGDGINSLFLAQALLYLRGTTPAGGDAGVGTPGTGFNGLPQNVTTWPAAPRSLRLPALVRSRHHGVLQATGQPGDIVGALVALDGAFGPPQPALQGTLLVPAASLALLLGPIDPLSGGLELDFVLPDLPAGVDGLRVFAQGLFFGSDGLTLGSASAMAWIDDGI